MRVRSLVAATALLALLAGPGLAQDVTWSEVNGRWVGEIAARYSVPTDGMVDVSRVIADVEVVGSDRDDMDYRYVFTSGARTSREEAEARFADEPLTVSETRDGLEIEGERKRFRWNSDRDYTLKLILEVPASVRIAVETSGGDVDVQNLAGEADIHAAGGDIVGRSVTGPVRVQSAGGDIEWADGRGDIRLTSHGGDVLLERSEGTLRLVSSGGDCDVVDVEGDLTVNSSGGDITGRRIEVDILDMAASGGDIDLTDVTARRRAELASHGGDIDLEASEGDFTMNSSGGDLMAFRHTGRITAHASGGDLAVEELNGSMISAQVAGNAYLSLAEGAAVTDDSAIEVTTGNLTLAVPERVGVTVDAVVDHGGRGSIDTDFPLEMTHRNRLNRARGDIQGGGAVVTLHTGTGSIRIKRL